MAKNIESKEYRLSQPNGQIVLFNGALVAQWKDENPERPVTWTAYRTDGGNWILFEDHGKDAYNPVKICRGTKALSMLSGAVRRHYGEKPMPQGAIDFLGKVDPDLRRRFIVEVE